MFKGVVRSSLRVLQGTKIASLNECILFRVQWSEIVPLHSIYIMKANSYPEDCEEDSTEDLQKGGAATHHDTRKKHTAPTKKQTNYWLLFLIPATIL